MKWYIYLAQDLGIRIIQLAGYDVYYNEGSTETKKQFQTNKSNISNDFQEKKNDNQVGGVCTGIGM